MPACLLDVASLLTEVFRPTVIELQPFNRTDLELWAAPSRGQGTSGTPESAGSGSSRPSRGWRHAMTRASMLQDPRPQSPSGPAIPGYPEGSETACPHGLCGQPLYRLLIQRILSTYCAQVTLLYKDLLRSLDVIGTSDDSVTMETAGIVRSEDPGAAGDFPEDGLSRPRTVRCWPCLSSAQQSPTEPAAGASSPPESPRQVSELATGSEAGRAAGPFSASGDRVAAVSGGSERGCVPGPNRIPTVTAP